MPGYFLDGYFVDSEAAATTPGVGQMLPFSASMFNADVTIRRVGSTIGRRGGVSPAPTAGTAYRAIVSPAKMAYGEARDVPESTTPYDVYVAYDADDTLIPALISGDEVQWGTKHLVVKGPADDIDQQHVVWWLQCWAVQ
jgi:hypothetical protein